MCADILQHGADERIEDFVVHHNQNASMGLTSLTLTNTPEDLTNHAHQCFEVLLNFFRTQEAIAGLVVTESEASKNGQIPQAFEFLLNGGEVTLTKGPVFLGDTLDHVDLPLVFGKNISPQNFRLLCQALEECCPQDMNKAFLFQVAYKK